MRALHEIAARREREAPDLEEILTKPKRPKAEILKKGRSLNEQQSNTKS